MKGLNLLYEEDSIIEYYNNYQSIISKWLSYLIALLFVLLPFEEALASSAGTILKYLGILVAVICFISCLKKEKIILTSIHIFLSVWIFYGMLSIFWSDSIYWWKYFIRIYLNLFLIFIALTLVPIKFIKIDIIRKGIICGSLLASLILILTPNASHFTDEGRRTIMLMGTMLDPNIVASIISMGIFSAISLIFKKNSNKLSLKITIYIFIMIIAVLFTGSRGAFIAVSIGLLLWFLLTSQNKIKKMKLLILFLISIGIILIIMPDDLMQSRFNYEALLGINEVKTDTHSRYKIWSYIPQLFFNNPILGYGYGNFMTTVQTIYRFAASHNMYILILIEGGIIGFLLFTIPIILTVYKLYKKKLYDEFIMFVVILILCITLDGITYKFLWFSWAFVFLKYKLYLIQNYDGRKK